VKTFRPTFRLWGLELPLRITVASIVACLAIILGSYVQLSYLLIPTADFTLRLRLQAYDHFLLYLIIPLLVIQVGFRQPASDYGFRLGDWKMGLKLTLAAWVLTAPVLLIATRSPEVASYYDGFYKDPLDVVITAAIELFAWEFLMRGFILWALWEVAGPSAIVLQMIPFALAHIGKPAIETISTVFTGIIFGWVGWRTRSFLYPFLIHLFISVFAVLAVAWGH
jgi:membrane protease YdiL (CAAX protease family)